MLRIRTCFAFYIMYCACRVRLGRVGASAVFFLCSVPKKAASSHVQCVSFVFLPAICKNPVKARYKKKWPKIQSRCEAHELGAYKVTVRSEYPWNPRRSDHNYKTTGIFKYFSKCGLICLLARAIAITSSKRQPVVSKTPHVPLSIRATRSFVFH